MTNHKSMVARESGLENVNGAIPRNSLLVSPREMAERQVSVEGD